MRKFPSLASLIAKYDKDVPLDICMVTPDLLGPVRNGGIGTACAYLAYALQDAGNKVHILFTPQGLDESHGDWRPAYEARGISITIIDINKENNFLYFPSDKHLATSLHVYEWLSQHDYFDLALFMDLYGTGFYSLCAKKCGLKFLNTVMAMIVHSPTLWHAINNISLSGNPQQACTWHVERRAIEMADAVISPSAYMLEWCISHNYKIGPNAFVQPNLLDCRQKCAQAEKLDEAVFFGRLEYRKGLEEFCDALDILAAQNRLPPKITFLGKCAWVGNEHSISYIARRMEKWAKANIGLIIDKNHDEAISYLLEGARFCIMPSVADNSPYTVYECLAMGIPFLARDTGGVKELIAPGHRAGALFGDNPRDLADKIARFLDNPPQKTAIAFDMRLNVKAWQSGLRALCNLVKSRSRKPAQAQKNAFISVCVTHHNRPGLLKQCIESLLAQTCKNFEVILADDGSDDADAIAYLNSLDEPFKKLGWRILRLPHGYVGHARNMAAQAASGAWLLFLDDDNIAMPHMLETFAKTLAHGRRDLTVSSFQVFEGMDLPEKSKIAERFLPIGDIVSYSIIANSISDTTALINKKTFFQLGGFSEDYGIGHEDFELYLRFALAHKDIGVIPDALFWYRRAENKNSVQLMTRAEVNYMRSMRPFMDFLPAGLAEMALMCHGMGIMSGCYPALKIQLDRPPTIKAPGQDSGIDPQSGEALTQIFLYLEDMGQNTLASQIKKAINTAGAETQSALELTSRLYEKARAGNAAALAANLDLYEKNGKSLRGKKRCQFYLSLLAQTVSEKSPYPCKKILIGRLNEFKAPDIFTALTICEHSIRTQDVKIILMYFFKALAIAEEEYKNIRVDVAEAIDSGAFICALQHYAMHGHSENSNWPHKNMFGRILSSSPKLFTDICNVHMATYNYKNKKISELIFNILKYNPD